MTSTIPPPMRTLMQLFAEIDNPLPSHAERVRIRKDAGLSQRALSIALGVAERNVCNWEKPDAPEPTPTHKALYRLALEELDRRTKTLRAKQGSIAKPNAELAFAQK